MVTTDGVVISVSSKVLLQCGAFIHLPLMNLHPAPMLDSQAVAALIEEVTEGMGGYLLETGRYWHFYGATVLTEDAWLRFLAQFLMPVVLVSPRYIGHSLYRGYATLRLTIEPQYKPTIPSVVQVCEAR
jgi:hypothetical protein